MAKNVTSLLFAFLLPIVLSAQLELEGLWEGTITQGGLDSRQAYKFELLIKREGDVLTGRTYVHLGKDEVIEMEFVGKLYYDRSLYLEDLKFIPLEGVDVVPPFLRKYQLIFNRSIWDSSLNGYWQEITRKDPMDPRRERGRIALKKIKASKA